MSDTPKVADDGYMLDPFGIQWPIEDVEAGRVTQFFEPGKLFKLNTDGTYSPSVPEGDPEYGKRYRVKPKEAG